MMWSIVRPATLQASRVGATTSAASWRTVGVSSRFVLVRPAVLRLTERSLARGLATAASTKKTPPAATAGRAAKPKTDKTAAAKKTKMAAKAKPKKKMSKAKPKPKRVPKEKELSPSALKKALKEKGLVFEEPSLPTANPWTTFFTMRISKGGRTTEQMKALVEEYENLTVAERESLKETAAKTSEAKRAAYAAWVESYTPDQIHEANKARRRLRKLAKANGSKISSSFRDIADSRMPARPGNAYMNFFRVFISKVNAQDRARMPIHELAKIASAEYKSLPASELKTYQDIADAEKARYFKERALVLPNLHARRLARSESPQT